MQKRKRLHSKNQGQQLQYFSDIKAGDYVVHKVHGIGRYIGVENVEVSGVHRDYLLLAYAGEDKLYVPVEQVGMLHKYVGSEGSVPRLSKMGGADWKRTTTKAAKAITELAEELLRLYAQRQVLPGHAFAPDTEWQKEFEEQFPYEETPDQLKCISEIKNDMEKAASRDPYEIFLGGADPLIIIENPNAEREKELVVFRDSFGSSLVPLLVSEYSKVTLIDTRYMQSAAIGSFVKFDNQDVLFLYSTLILNNSLAMK